MNILALHAYFPLRVETASVSVVFPVIRTTAQNSCSFQCDLENNQKSTLQSSDEKQREQVITITAKDVPGLVAVRAYDASGNEKNCDDLAACVRSLQITIVPKIVLPDEKTEAGLLTRVLLAESISPSYLTDYGDGKEIIETMKLMRTVLENRIKAAQTNQGLKNLIACNPATLDFKGIVFASQCGSTKKTQIEGFRNGKIDTKQANTIANIVSIANDGTNSRFDLFRRHVEAAIAVAEGSKLSNDNLSADSLMFWVTAGSAPPSDYAVKHSTRGGQDFYTLTQGYLNNPNQPGSRP